MAAPPPARQAKSRFQREKEEREQKRLLEEKEAASVFKDFVAEFNPDTRDATVRSGGGGESVAIRTQQKSKRQIDAFLEELKAKQPEEDDADSSNLYVGNLAPSVTEDALRSLFGRFGKVDSVKIMWPRSEGERMRGKNCGFVCLSNREEAAKARDAMNEYDFQGQKLTVGWGKAVSTNRNPVENRVNLQPASSRTGEAVGQAARNGGGERVVLVDENEPPGIKVIVPVDPEQREVIDVLSEFVARDGEVVEKAVAEREKHNPHFSFLRSNKSAEAIYYRYKVYSLLMGKEKIDETPFFMQTNGAKWFPPAPKKMSVPPPGSEEFLTGRQAEKAREREEKGQREVLDQDDKDFFRMMVSRLTISRAKIAEATCFAFDNVEAAPDIVDIIRGVFAVGEPTTTTSLSSRISRLYLVSDMLRNSSVALKGAQQYRSRLQSILPEIVLDLNVAARAASDDKTSPAGRIFRDRVVAVFAVWLRWSMFPAHFVHGLESTFFESNLDEEGCFATSTLDNEPSQLDLDALKRKARLFGVPDAGDRRDLLTRLARAQAYSKFRALGHDPRKSTEMAVDHAKKERRRENKRQQAVTKTKKTTRSLPQKKSSGTWVDASALAAEETQDDDQDIDGDPIDDDLFNSVPDYKEEVEKSDPVVVAAPSPAVAPPPPPPPKRRRLDERPPPPPPPPPTRGDHRNRRNRRSSSSDDSYSVCSSPGRSDHQRNVRRRSRSPQTRPPPPRRHSDSRNRPHSRRNPPPPRRRRPS